MKDKITIAIEVLDLLAKRTRDRKDRTINDLIHVEEGGMMDFTEAKRTVSGSSFATERKIDKIKSMLKQWMEEL